MALAEGLEPPTSRLLTTTTFVATKSVCGLDYVIILLRIVGI